MSDPADVCRRDPAFDHLDHEAAYNPFPRWAELRKDGRVAHSDRHGGYFIASRYEDVAAVSQDHEVFSSFLRQTTIPQLTTPPFPPINYDQPEHREYRVIINPFFAPAAVRRHTEWIQELADSDVERLLPTGAFNMPLDVGIPLTRDVIFRLMGIVDAPEAVKGWADDLVYITPNAAKAGESLMGFIADELEKRRAKPGDDIMSIMLSAQYEDRPLRDDEILRMSLLVLLAGLDTTNSAMSGAVWYLVQHPDRLEELSHADDKTWRLAVDEFVRWTSPAPAQARTARTDTEIRGCPVKAGEMVLLLNGSANRDETVFENPDEVIFDRSPNHHLGFGSGAHRCIGMHLAKLEMQIVLQTLIKAGLADFKLADPGAVVWHAASVRGIGSMPLVRK